MAVLKMKKLRLIMLRSRRDDILRELISRGCVELKMPDMSTLDAPLPAEVSELAALEEKLALLQRAIALLEKYSSAIKRMQFGRDGLEAHVLLDDTGLNFALKKAGDTLAINEKLHFARFEQQRLRRLVEELKDWHDVDAPLHLMQTERCAVILGTVNAATDMEKLSAELEAIDQKAELFLLKEDKKHKYIGLLCMTERGEEMRAALKQKGFAPAPHTDTPGSAQQCSSDAQSSINEHLRQEEHCKKRLSEESIHWRALQLAYDRVSVKIALARAEEKLCGTESTLLLEGWVPACREVELSALFDAYGCAYDIAEPTAEEKNDVPLLLDSGDGKKRDALKGLKMGLRRGRPFQPLEIRTKYYKLAE